MVNNALHPLISRGSYFTTFDPPNNKKKREWEEWEWQRMKERESEKSDKSETKQEKQEEREERKRDYMIDKLIWKPRIALKCLYKVLE